MDELWQEICFTLQDIAPSSSEELYEQKVIQLLEKLGWSRYRNEIVLKKNIQLGSAGRIIPDIIVNSIGKNESFVIEVKKPSEDIENNSHKNQLFSYMRQLKLTHGFLIGNKIQIYYDGEHNKSKNPVLLKSFEINKDNQNGALFIKLFQKETFSYIGLECFAEKIIKELTVKDQKEKIYNLLLSKEYQNKLKYLVAKELQINWDKKIIENTLANFNLSITLKGIETPSVTSIPAPLNTQSSMKIGQLVKTNLKFIIAFCEASEKELLNLKSEIYSKQTFNINYPFFKKVTSESSKQDRYWKDKYVINNQYYVVTSEWFKGSLPFFQDYLARMAQNAKS